MSATSRLFFVAVGSPAVPAFLLMGCGSPGRLTEVTKTYPSPYVLPIMGSSFAYLLIVV
jgi:hypothetical protein